LSCLNTTGESRSQLTEIRANAAACQTDFSCRQRRAQLLIKAVKTLTAIFILVIAGLVAFLIIQQHAQEKLRAENDLLAQQLVQSQTDNENFSNQLAQTKDSQSFSDDKMNELLKLRGEVGLLQQQTNELGTLRDKLNQLQSQVQDKQTNQLSTEDQFKLSQMHVQDAMSMLVIAIKKFAEDHDGQYPTSFNQLDLNSINFTSNIGLSDFEFINSNGPQGEKLILRAKNPIQNPDGNWIWIYGGTNANTETFNSASPPIQ
jgi:hypothetical protein